MRTSIFTYTDYRTFLKAHFAERQKKNPQWSYQAWASKLGLKNNTSLLKILHNQREMGPRIQLRLEEYFQFNPSERSYFEDLVRLSKAKNDPTTSVLIRSRLQRHRPEAPKVFIDDRSFSAISSWWYYAIRQLARVTKLPSDPAAISKLFRFKVTPREVGAAVKTMLSTGMLAADPATGILRAAKGGLDTSDDVASEGLRRFHEQVLANAALSVRTVSPEEREVSGVTLAVAADRIPEMKVFIRKFEDEFNQIFGCGEGSDVVYQLEVALFPFTKRLSQKGEEK